MDGQLTERDVILAKREGYVEAQMRTYGRCFDSVCDICLAKESDYKAEARKLYPLPGKPREVVADGCKFRFEDGAVFIRYPGNFHWLHYVPGPTARAIADLIQNPTIPDPEDADE